MKNPKLFCQKQVRKNRLIKNGVKQVRIGIFGGSFNPIHNGHIELIRGIVSELALDKLFVVPSFLPPHKSVKSPVSPEDRLKMCRLSVSDILAVEVSDIEIKRGGKSYTYETLQELHRLYPDDTLFLIMGADMFLSIETWKKPEVIFNLATICGVPRKGISKRQELLDREPFLQSLGAETKVLRMELPEISSTEIREAVKNGNPIDKLVPKRVEEYILEKGLYLQK